MIDTNYNIDSLRRTGLDVASAGLEGIYNLRRLMKAVKKSAQSSLFPEDNRLLHFFLKHPVAAKLFFFTQFVTFVDLATRINKLPKRIKQVGQKQGWQRYDALSKVTSVTGKILGNIAGAIACLQLLRLSKKLGPLKLIPLNPIALLGSLLASASIFHKGYKAYQIHQVQKAFQRHDWYRHDGGYTSKEYQLFKTYITEMSDPEAKALGKACKTKGPALKKALTAKLLTDDPSQADLQQMAKLVEAISSRLIGRKRYFLLASATSTLDLAATLCMLSPPLFPVASLLIGVISCAKLSKLLFKNITRYQFENRLDLIDRPAPSASFKSRALDFAKWQIGWYESRNTLSRVAQASSSIGIGTSQTAAALSNSLLAVSAAASLAQVACSLVRA